MLQMPTGAGKTLLAAGIISNALRKGKRATFIVPAISLVDQTVEAFWAEGIRDVGVMQALHPLTDRSKPVQIASADTLIRRLRPETDLVLVDEAHRMKKAVTDWMEEAPELPFIGLSATPWTKGLGRLYDNLIIPTTTAELIAKGYLSPFRVFAPSKPDLKGVRTIAGDYREDDLAKAMAPLTGDVVQTWLTHGEGRPTLCFAVDRAHAKFLQLAFEAAGVPSAYMDAHTELKDRKAIHDDFAAGKVKVVCNVGVLTTGVDWDVRCIILARPTKSEMLYVQIIGRGLRTADGKQNCKILDHSDTTLRLGFVTDIHHERLDDGKIDEAATRDAKEPLPKDCPVCHYVRPAGVAICPSCGFKPEQRPEGAKTEDGELTELDAARAKSKADWAEKIAFMAQLKAHAIASTKSDGWVAQKYKAKFGMWPNDPRVKYVQPAAGVSPEIKSWITAQNIKYAKSQARRSA